MAPKRNSSGSGSSGGVSINPDPATSIVAAFAQLALYNNWKPKSSTYRRQRARFVADEFESQFGSNLGGLSGWQELCRAVGLVVVPTSVTQCKKLLKTVHVNIYDLVDAARSGVPARTFKSTRALAVYTKENGKVFAKEVAKGNRLLKFMLRTLDA